jgi:two-component system, sensor histidine kinase and response regulator
MSTYASLVRPYDYRLITLTVLVAILRAHATLDLADQLILLKESRRSCRLCGGLVVLGMGIWCIYSIGMEAFHQPILVRYDWPTILVSIAAAIPLSAAALFAVGIMPGCIARHLECAFK